MDLGDIHDMNLLRKGTHENWKSVRKKMNVRFFENSKHKLEPYGQALPFFGRVWFVYTLPKSILVL